MLDEMPSKDSLTSKAGNTFSQRGKLRRPLRWLAWGLRRPGSFPLLNPPTLIPGCRRHTCSQHMQKTLFNPAEQTPVCGTTRCSAIFAPFVRTGVRPEREHAMAKKYGPRMRGSPRTQYLPRPAYSEVAGMCSERGVLTLRKTLRPGEEASGLSTLALARFKATPLTASSKYTSLGTSINLSFAAFTGSVSAGETKSSGRAQLISWMPVTATSACTRSTSEPLRARRPTSTVLQPIAFAVFRFEA